MMRQFVGKLEFNLTREEKKRVRSNAELERTTFATTTVLILAVTSATSAREDGKNDK